MRTAAVVEEKPGVCGRNYLMGVIPMVGGSGKELDFQKFLFCKCNSELKQKSFPSFFSSDIKEKQNEKKKKNHLFSTVK